MLPVTRVIGHKEYAKPFGRKIDPTYDMNWRRNRVASFTPRGTDDVNLTDQIPQENIADGKGGYTRRESTSVANALGSTHAAMFYDNPYGPALAPAMGKVLEMLADVQNDLALIKSRPVAARLSDDQLAEIKQLIVAAESDADANAVFDRLISALDSAKGEPAP